MPPTDVTYKSTDDRVRRDVVRYSAQTPQPDYYGYNFRDFHGSYSSVLPSLYDERRQAVLRIIALNPQNNLEQSARATLHAQLSNAPYEISGGRRYVQKFQDIFNNAQYGEGWTSFLSRVLDDFWTSDDGAVIELIGRGAKDRPLPRVLIEGIAALDTRRCFFTGNPEYPVWYQDAELGTLHKLHWTRCIRLTDYRLSDPKLRGRGICALSRSIGWVQQAIVQMSYIGESLDNKPPPGILLVNGAVPEKWADAWAMYEAALRQQGIGTYKPVVEYLADEGENVTIEFIRFSQQPEHYDPIAQLEAQVKGVALGYHMDPQDLWPLTGGNFGTNTQSKVLDKKSQGKAIGYMLKILERAFNERIVPDFLRFEFKHRDTETEKADAEALKLQVETAEAIARIADYETARRYLMSVSQQILEAMTEDDGTIRRYDDDPEPDTAPPEVVLTDEQGPNPDDATQTAGDDTPLEAARSKEFDDVRFDFERNFYTALESFNNDETTRSRAGTIMRSIIDASGRRARLEGLSMGGVILDSLSEDEDEAAAHLMWMGRQSRYLRNMLDSINRREGPISEAELRGHVEMWGNKSLQEAYLEGVESADKNGNYEFGGLDGDESCSDCKRLKGQIHRMKDWARKQLRPGIDTDSFECGGWRCQHRLIKTAKRARGRW